MIHILNTNKLLNNCDLIIIIIITIKSQIYYYHNYNIYSDTNVYKCNSL